jgi:hypothetical protein
MSDKEAKIRTVYNSISDALQPIPVTIYDTIMQQNKVLDLLRQLYEAGRVEGELSKIKDN